MRAKTVFEAINFQRGLEPKEALGIGRRGQFARDMDEAELRVDVSEVMGSWFIKALKEHAPDYEWSLAALGNVSFAIDSDKGERTFVYEGEVISLVTPEGWIHLGNIIDSPKSAVKKFMEYYES